MMTFFLNAEGKVYARFGGRDPESPDRRQTLAGLHYTMESVLQMHGRQDKTFAARSREAAQFARDLSGRRRGGCMHCHQVKERIHADLKRKGQWSQDLAWRYPLPENLGFDLEFDRGNVVKRVKVDSPAAAVGLKPGDVLQRLGGVPVHSFGDAQFALDRAPKSGTVEVVWQRAGEVRSGNLTLSEGWRKTDILWRPSLGFLVPRAHLNGTDLTGAERKVLDLSKRQLAFRQRDTVSSAAKAAGIRGGDVILGLDGKVLEMDVYDFQRYVQRHYLAGDRVMVNVLRGGKRMDLPMTLVR
jgi:S1-C subfamily serine protease